MAKLNEGDVIEGIFTIALALYLAHGKVDKRELNKIRTQIDTKMFNTGRFKHSIGKNLKRQKPGKPADFFNVDIEMRLKPESIVGAFGKDFQVYYKKSTDIGNIDKKIDQLIKATETASFTTKADQAVDKFLNNNVGEAVTFVVIADGIAGESSGGDIKGDVTLEIYAQKMNSKQKISSGSISFSLKSESVTVSNLSPYKGMLDIASALKIKWDAKEKYQRLSKPFKGPEEQKAKFELIESMYDRLSKEIVTASKTASFTKNAMDFLGKNIFGSDSANVIDVQKGAVKEITTEYFNILKNNITLEANIKGKNLVFVDKQSKTPIFQIRTKLRKEANEAKFYLEVGKGIYAK